MESQNEEEISDSLLDQVVLKEGELPYSEIPLYPKFLIQFLTRKLTVVKDRVEREGPFNPNIMSIRSDESISFYTNVLEALLEIKKPEN